MMPNNYGLFSQLIKNNIPKVSGKVYNRMSSWDSLQKQAKYLESKLEVTIYILRS